MIEMLKQVVKRVVVHKLMRKETTLREPGNDQFDGLPPTLWGCDINDEGCLTFEGLDALSLVEKYGSPLHVVNGPRLRENYHNFVQAFRDLYPKVDLATSYKTNPLPGVIRVLHQAGTWAEVISDFELWLAFKLGIASEQLILNGPGKGKHAIDVAVEAGIRLINLDGPEEIPWVVESAARYGRTPDVGLRVVSSIGWSAQFGSEIANGEAFRVFEEIKRHETLNPCGLHLHIGTGVSDVQLYVQAIEEVLEFGRRLKTDLDIDISIYDFGGGFGVPTVRSWDEWDMRMVALGYKERVAIPKTHPKPEDYARPIAELLNRYYPDSDGNKPHVLFEPGRAITSSAQTLLLRVMKIKRTPGLPDRIIVDGGKNMTMPLAWEYHQIFAAGKMDQPRADGVRLYGPLCHPGDIVAQMRDLPELAEGDVIAIMDAGAYFIPNQMNFSNPRPAAILVDNGSEVEIRSRETYADIVKLDNVG